MALSLQRPAAALIEKASFPVRYPPVAIEIAPTEVVAVRLRSDRTGRRLAGYGVAPHLSPVAPPMAPGVRSLATEELKQALQEAISSAGIKSGRASLLLPDSVARIWLLQVPELPRGHSGILEMIRWKIKKSVPFRIEDAAITWQVLARPSGNEPALILAGLIPRVVVHQYESVLASLGQKVGLVDLPSFNLFNAYRSLIESNGTLKEDFAVLNATEGYFTLMLFRQGEMIFYRCKTHPEGEAGAPEERLRTVRRELATSLSYYTEKLKGKSIVRTFVRNADPALGDPGEILASIGFGIMETIDPERIARLPEGLDPQTALSLVPALGAAAGRRA